MAGIYRSRVAMSGGIAGAGVSTMYWALDDEANKNDIGTVLSTVWTNNRGYIYTGLTLTLEPTIEKINETTGHLEDEVAITSWTMTGNDSGEPLPWATQGLLRFRTGVTMGTPAKEIRGRCFVPGPVEARSTNGRPVALYTSTMNDGINALITGTTHAKFGIWSKKNLTFALVTSGTCWGEWASLRSRRD